MIWLLVIAAGGIFLAVMGHIFFSPYRLGPAPASLLGKDFFLAPARRLPDMKLLIDGPEAFEKVLQDIAQAKKSLYIQTFIWKNDLFGQRMADAVIEAADRGVKVEIAKDALGTFFELMNKRPSLSPVFRDGRLKNHKNIRLSLNPFRIVDHSKYFITDKRKVTFGGMNIADEYYSRWHDYMVSVDGEDVAAWFYAKTAGNGHWPEGAPFVIAANTRMSADIRTAVMELLMSAKERLVLEQAYFSSSMVLKKIEMALQRGVKVDIILPENPSTHGPANRVAVNRLLASPYSDKLRCFNYPGMTHAKVMVADGAKVCIGSANMTPRSLHVSRETVMLAHFNSDHPFLKALNHRLEEDIRLSRRIEAPFSIGPVEAIRAAAGKYIW